MKAAIILLLFVFSYNEAKKIYQPVDKHVNTAFINMEGGGAPRPGSKPVVPAPVPSSPVHAPKSPTQAVPTKPVQPTPVQPTPVQPTPVKPQPQVPVQPSRPPTPHQIKPIPVNPAPVANPITTPGPGSVKQLVNFYDSQGKASPIRPYSYSQAVKQG